jgi:hypothetical protein
MMRTLPSVQEACAIESSKRKRCVDKDVKSGWCLHLDDTSYACKVWRRRPNVCREYDCDEAPLLQIMLEQGFVADHLGEQSSHAGGTPAEGSVPHSKGWMKQVLDERGWDDQALQDIVASGHTEAVILTDGNGRILFCDSRRAAPEPLGALLEMSLASHAVAGKRFGLGALRISASLHDAGAIVCGRTETNSIVILASERANLGQLLHHVRRILPQREVP